MVKLDIQNTAIGDLVPIRPLRRTKHTSSTIWLCRCICGKITRVQRGDLTSRTSLSCGCKRGERIGNALRIHGEGKKTNGEYKAWISMNQRCYNPGSNNYKYYGARGIKVCKKWRYNYLVFLADMGRKPSPLYSLDRINNNGNYTPANCRWATAAEQVHNRRKWWK